MRFVFYGFWIVSHICLALTLTFLVARHRWKQLPVFFTYLVFELVYFGAAIAAYVPWILFYPTHVSQTYYFVLLFGAGISGLLEFGVIYEIATILVISRSHLAATLNRVLRWAAALLLLLASAISAALSQPGVARIRNVFQTIEVSAHGVALGLLLVLLLFTRALKISWKSLPAGITLGFGIAAPINLAASALYSALGKPGYLTIDTISMAGFQLCTIVWLFYVLRPEKPREFTGKGLELSELELLDQQMEKMMRP